MRIDLAVTTLWAELATWSTSAAEVIVRPEYWAIHGATRMGKALTPEDRLEDAAIEPACLAQGVARAQAVMVLLAKADPAGVRWTEPTPAAASTPAEARAALARAHGEPLALEAIERLQDIAHALQAGATLAADARHADVLAMLARPPRVATRGRGPFSSLLAMGVGTLWVPTSLAGAWDSPACVLASSLQLATDLRALPACLREDDPAVAGELAGVGSLVRALERGLSIAGDTRSLVMTG